MKPQDILVLLKILLWKDRPWRQVDLAEELGLSQTEINFSLNRLVKSGLLDSTKRRPHRLAMAEFLLHGLRYVFPAELGRVGRGMSTAHSHGSMVKRIITEEKFVWPDPDGQQRGQFLEPLYPSVPFAAKNDPDLYEWLALIDAIRIGSSRVQILASKRISEKMAA